MLSSILPLKAIAYQSLFLLIAIAIEATILYQRLNEDAMKTLPARPVVSPKQSIQYATVSELLTAVVGWLVFFLFFSTTTILPADLQAALLNFIFFDKWTDETATLLILVSFITFFASLAVKHLGLLGLRWLLQGQEPAPPSPKADTEENPEPRVRSRVSVFRDLRKEPRQFQPQFNALLVANAWAYSAILAVLLLRLFVQNQFAL